MNLMFTGGFGLLLMIICVAMIMIDIEYYDSKGIEPSDNYKITGGLCLIVGFILFFSSLGLGLFLK